MLDAGRPLLQPHEEERDEDGGDESGRDHSGEDAGTHRLASCGTGAGYTRTPRRTGGFLLGLPMVRELVLESKCAVVEK